MGSHSTEWSPAAGESVEVDVELDACAVGVGDADDLTLDGVWNFGAWLRRRRPWVHAG